MGASAILQPGFETAVAQWRNCEINRKVSRSGHNCFSVGPTPKVTLSLVSMAGVCASSVVTETHQLENCSAVMTPWRNKNHCSSTTVSRASVTSQSPLIRDRTSAAFPLKPVTSSQVSDVATFSSKACAQYVTIAAIAPFTPMARWHDSWVLYPDKGHIALRKRPPNFSSLTLASAIWRSRFILSSSSEIFAKSWGASWRGLVKIPTSFLMILRRYTWRTVYGNRENVVFP